MRKRAMTGLTAATTLMAFLLLFLGFSGGLASPGFLEVDVAQAHDNDDLVETDFSWEGVIDKGDAIEISTVNGEIIAEPTRGDKVVVEAVKKTRNVDPDDVEIQVTETHHGFKIETKYPKHNGRRDNDDDHRHIQVDFKVKIPAGVRFEGSTVNGDIEAEDLEGPVSVSTVNGSVRLSTNQVASASTVNGTIMAVVKTGKWDEPLALSTVNGTIELRIPKSADADFEASTVNGSIESDFPITVQGKFSNKHFSGKIGDGGRELNLSTVNGSIRLLYASSR